MSDKLEWEALIEKILTVCEDERKNGMESRVFVTVLANVCGAMFSRMKIDDINDLCADFSVGVKLCFLHNRMNEVKNV